MIPQISEHEAVEKTVQGYIDSVANFDTGLVKKVFHPSATISGYANLPGAPEEGVFIFENAVDLLVGYMKEAPPVSETSPNYKGRVASVEVMGRLAVAVVLEESLEGRDFINHFQLQKVDGKWVITSKVLVSEPARS